MSNAMNTRNATTKTPAILKGVRTFGLGFTGAGQITVVLSPMSSGTQDEDCNPAPFEYRFERTLNANRALYC
jgi:hypothetical protein